ncbi:carB [Acrasis kona]
MKYGKRKGKVEKASKKEKVDIDEIAKLWNISPEEVLKRLGNQQDVEEDDENDASRKSPKKSEDSDDDDETDQEDSTVEKE